MRPLIGATPRPPGSLCGATASHVALSSRARQDGRERCSKLGGAHHVGWTPHLADGCLSGPSVVFPNVMLLWVSKPPALATPRGCVCCLDHLQSENLSPVTLVAQHELTFELPLASSTNWTQLSPDTRLMVRMKGMMAGLSRAGNLGIPSDRSWAWHSLASTPFWGQPG